MDSLKKIINEVFVTDIDLNSRDRNSVDGRKAYSKILRDVGLSYLQIGRTLNKNHATIIHYYKSCNHLVEYDSVFKKKFNLVVNDFFEKNKNLKPKSNNTSDYLVFELKMKLDLALSEKNKILNDFINHLELYVKEKGYMPDVSYCRNNILPLLTG
jgi:hypothetical protein